MGKFSFKNTAKKNKNLKYGGYMTIVVIFALIALIVVNLLFQQLKITVDLTPEQFYTIGSKTKLILENVEDDVTIYGLYVTGKENDSAVSLIEDYIKNCGKVSYQQVDPYTNPEFTQPYRQDNETIASNSLIVVNDRTGKYKIVSESDLYQYKKTLNQSKGQYEYEVTAFKAEEALTSAIQYVISENTPVLYTLTGHGETALDSSIATLLGKANFQIKDLNLLMPDEELTANNYTVVMINNPMQDLSKQEYETLQAYLDDGGRLLLNLSVNYPENMTNFDTLLARYGVSVEQGSLIDTNANYYYGYVNFLMPDLGDHDVTENVAQKQVLVPMPIALKVEEDRNRATQITPILTTSDDAIVKKDKNSTVMDYEEGDVKGPFYVGLMVEESLSAGSEVKNTRIAVLGSSLMFDSQNYMTGANYDLLYNTLNYLQTEVDTLYISAKEYTTDTLTITEANMVGWSIVFVVAIPLALVVAGLVVWSRRKHL